jgi:hypothetical protein
MGDFQRHLDLGSRLIIVITYKNSAATSDLTDRLGRIERTLTRVEDVLAPGRPSEPADTIAAGGRGLPIR